MSSSRIFNGKLVQSSDINLILQPGEMSVDINAGALYIHDGVTPGGKLIGGTGQQGGSGAQGLPGVGITNAQVDPLSGNLFITLSNYNQINAGNVVGPQGATGTTTVLFTATIQTGFGLQYNSDGTISVNTSAVQTLLPIIELGQVGNQTTEIDTPVIIHGNLSSYSLTVTNFIAFPDGSILTSARNLGTGTSTGSYLTTASINVGFGLQKNGDGTISINSSTIQSILPILELTVNNTATTVIDNNTFVQGLLGANSFTVTNAIYFPDSTQQITAWLGSTSTIVNGSQSITVDGNQGLAMNNVQYIYPTTTGTSVDIYTGSQNNYSEVWLFDNGPVKISTYGETHSWSFGIDGSLTFPDTTVQSTAWTGSTSTLVSGTYTVSLRAFDGVLFVNNAVQMANNAVLYNFVSNGDSNLAIEAQNGRIFLEAKNNTLSVNTNSYWLNLQQVGQLNFDAVSNTDGTASWYPGSGSIDLGLTSGTYGSSTGKWRNVNLSGSIYFNDGTSQTTAFSTASYINKATLKSIVAASTSFTDFQTRIAAL